MIVLGLHLGSGAPSRGASPEGERSVAADAARSISVARSGRFSISAAGIGAVCGVLRVCAPPHPVLSTVAVEPVAGKR